MSGGAPLDPENVVTLDIQQSAESAFIVDMNQHIVAWNRSAELALGHRAQDVVGRKCYEILNPDGQSTAHPCRADCAVMGNARRNRPTRSIEAPAATYLGAPQRVSISSAVVRSAAGNKRVIHVFRDAERFHRLDEQVARAVAQRPRVESARAPQVTPYDDTAVPGNGLDAPEPQPTVTQRELEVLHLLVRGLNTGQIATTLGISPLTARNHVTRLMEKLNAGSRLQAVVIAAELGLL